MVITAVEGMGGVGKTELAIQYSLLHLQSHSYPGGICWLKARESDIGLQILQFATTDLGWQPREDLELQQQVRWCWQHWQHWQQGNTLIVFDDVKNYSHIEPYLPPQASQFKVLITTRLKLYLASSLFLPVLSETDALLLLAQLIGEEKQNQELAQAKELCQRLGYLPLALQLVGRYVKKRKITLAELLRRLEEKGLGHPSLVVNGNDPTWTLNIKRGVEAAFELSWSELSESAQQLGCLLSLFALAPILWSLVESAAVEQDLEELEDTRLELENLHLLQGEDSSYQLHQLIREFFRNKQENLASADKQKFSFCQAMVKVAQKVPNSPTRDFQLLTPFMIHVEATTALSKWLGNQEQINIYKSLGIFYEGQGFYNKSKERFEECLSASKNQWGDKHPDIAISLNYLALLDLYQGHWQKAEDKCQKALKIFDEEENHSVKAKTLTNLGIIYTNQGKWTEAILQYQQALKICQQLEDHYEDEEACTLGNLANIYYLQGAWEEATHIYQQVLNIFAQSGNYRREGQTLVALGNLYLWQGNLKEAVKFYEKALEIFSELKEPRGEGQALGNLSSLRLLEGKCNEADEQYQKALEIFRKIEDPKNEATVLINQGNVYRLRGNLEKAKEYYQQALNIFHKKLGDRQGEAQVLTNLGTIYADQGQWDLAKQKYFEAQGLFFELGDRQGEAQVLMNLGNIYRCQGRQSEALGLFSQALDIFKMMGVGDRQGEGLVLMNLGSLYTDQGCWSEAIKKCNEALEIFWELGNLQCEAETLIKLGIAYTDQEDWDKGIENCQQAIAIFSQIKCCQGEGQALGNLGNIYFLQGNKEKAMELWQEALIKLPVGSLAYKRIDEWLKSINRYL